MFRCPFQASVKYYIYIYILKNALVLVPQNGSIHCEWKVGTTNTFLSLPFLSLTVVIPLAICPLRYCGRIAEGTVQSCVIP